MNIKRNHIITISLGSLLLISSCGETVQRDDSQDRQQLQICLDEDGTPIYETDKTYEGIVIISYIACDK